MVALASKALETNSDNDKSQRKAHPTTHVQFCTESCIPITSLQDCANKIISLQDDRYNMDCSFLDHYCRNDTKCTRFDERKIFIFYIYIQYIL